MEPKQKKTKQKQKNPHSYQEKILFWGHSQWCIFIQMFQLTKSTRLPQSQVVLLDKIQDAQLNLDFR